MSGINLLRKFEEFQEQWSPKIIGELNGQHVKIARIKGEFVWHRHENEDELFYVVKGEIILRLRDKDITLQSGDMYIVPRGVEHQPFAEEEAFILMFEPAGTLNTGSSQSERTVGSPEWI